MRAELKGNGRFEHESHGRGVEKRARSLRKDMTVGEKLLWAELRKLGRNFRRQAPMGSYVADFISHSARLVIEVDSPWHEFPDRALQDKARDAWFERQGYKTLRFQSIDVHDRIDDVLLTIKHTLAPLPLNGEGAGGRGVSPQLPEESRSAPNALSASSPEASPPTPTLPPLRGKGDMQRP